jgi:hypothetical protein
MPIVFNYENVKVTEFGLGMDDQNRAFIFVPVDEAVQSSLIDMVEETQNQMEQKEDHPSDYEPSEKYSSLEYLTLSLSNELVKELKILHESENLDENINAFNDMERCFAYFVKLTDDNDNRVTAVRRSTQFKTLIKKRNRLVQYVDNTLTELNDTVFKLDNDFDFIIQNDLIHILRPSGLEFTAQLQRAVMEAVPGNIAVIEKEISFVDFESISKYAQLHPRAARYIASIKSLSEASNVSHHKLNEYCKKTNVQVNEIDGKMHIDDSQVMGFLEILDRRRYEIDLVDDAKPEVYRAPSRNRVDK